jgi:hypothetical protein
MAKVPIPKGQQNENINIRMEKTLKTNVEWAICDD